MNPVRAVLDTVRQLAEKTPGLYASIMIGSLPAANGLCMQIGAGAPDATFFTRSMEYRLHLVCNAKHVQQETALDALDAIHRQLTQKTVYPRSDLFQITNISTDGAPSCLGRDPDGQWLYGSSLTVRFFYYQTI